MLGEAQNVFQAETVADYDLENDGLHSLYFGFGHKGYFTLCRDFDGQDETIYFEKDDQTNYKYIYPSNVQYIIENGKVEFLIDDSVARDDMFWKRFIISFTPLPKADYEKMKNKLAIIWSDGESV